MRCFRNQLRVSSFIIALLFTNSALAESTTDFLHAFHADPNRMMQRLPVEVRPDGRTVLRGFIDEKAVRSQLPFRRRVQDRIAADASRFRKAQEGIDPQNLAAKIVDDGVVAQAVEIERAKLLSATLDPMPWSDSYWPLYKGMIARRYADPAFPNAKSYSENRAYTEVNPAHAILRGGNAETINRLSPAEKYDIAVGDPQFTLTHFAWAAGEKNMINGDVPKWMGICHGWAAASHMQASYTKTPVTVPAPSGQSIVFYPHDVKALQSMLWANANLTSRFIGTRCKTSRPPRSRNGRVLEPKCFDVDPATWHLVMVNQVGKNKRSFVMDSDYDLEVWNYPLAGYRITYFNPQSWEESAKLRNATIPIEKYSLDKFREFRLPNARHVVGIRMDVTHVAAIEPTTSAPAGRPQTKTIRFYYDLEMDADMNIIGGEWFSNAHPDFLWTHANDTQAIAYGEKKILEERWVKNSGVPPHWTEVAQKASARGEPLFSFIHGLLPMKTEETPATDATPNPPAEPMPDNGGEAPATT